MAANKPAGSHRIFRQPKLRQLKARERLNYHLRRFDSRFGIPKFEEFLILIKRESVKAGREVGICPELKHAEHHRVSGLPLEEPMCQASEGLRLHSGRLTLHESVI